jgi:hypothetical protein
LPPELPPELIKAFCGVSSGSLKNQGQNRIEDFGKVLDGQQRALPQTGALTELRYAPMP